MDISILMPTYNHEKYIAKAIESVLLQKTNYKWELLINDDCSTDSTREIAKKYESLYPDKIKLVFPEQNQGLLKSYKRLLELSKGSFIAILESDDFWNDNSNLQKKIDYLIKQPEYGLIASQTNLIDKNNDLLRVSTSDYSETGNWYTELLYGNTLRAVSVIFRKSIFDTYCNIDEYIEKDFQTFDYPVWLSISAHAKCKYLNEKLCSYRVLDTSISNNKSYYKLKKFSNSIHKIQKYIIEKYPPTEDFSYRTYKQITAYKDMLLALKHHNFINYYINSKKISAKGDFKLFIIKYFSIIFYIQHILGGQK